ncbi:MAG: DNA polymerase III subunit gamma/tau [Alicyclobacillaceae bacterium]|nr:DNA polymerase III subunit gamma/tau [Alicyclobacillaceae bacterium]
MGYQALYRTRRPQRFEDIVGQAHVRTTLQNALQSGHVAHAYLFTGPRGTGKTSAAKVLSKAVNCLSPDGVEPCNQCQACRTIMDGSNVDVEEIDAASNRGVDEIRTLREKVNYAPTSLQRKVYIIDEVHMLTSEAFNALLKTLEEPPQHALFVLATTEPHKIPGTIASRCQRFDFRRIEPSAMVERMHSIASEEGWEVSEEALWQLADIADGGLRDALSLLEQCVAYGQAHVDANVVAMVVGGIQPAKKMSLLKCLHEGQLLEVMDTLGEFYEAGKDAARIVADILKALRDVLIAKLTVEQGQQLPPTFLPYEPLAAAVRTEWVLNALSKLNDAYTGLRFAEQPRLLLETAFLDIAREQLMPKVSVAPVKTMDAVKKTNEAAIQARASSVGAAGAGSAERKVLTAAPSDVPAHRSARAPMGTKNRKQEVLDQLHQAADLGTLQRIQAQWESLLTEVRQRRIQTHAWLMYGQPVLATATQVVFVFASKIHRDAVMKPDERSTIEAALEEVLGQPMSILALLQVDWDDWSTSSASATSTSLEDRHGGEEWIHAVETLFGKDLVEYSSEE